MSTNVSLTSELEAFVQEKVRSGYYASTSEVIRAGLRLLKEQEAIYQAKLDALKEEIHKGKESEKVPYDIEAIKAEAQARIAKKQEG